MWSLIKKDLVRVLSLTLMIFLIFVYFIVNDLDPGEKSPFYWGMWMFILLAGGITNIEKNEEKYQGYRFLAQLPVSDREIVQAKYAVLFMLMVYIGILNFIMGFIFPIPGEIERLSRIFLVLFGWLFLLMSGLIYILVFKKGLSKAMFLIWVSVIGGLIIFIFVLDFVLDLIKNS